MGEASAPDVPFASLVSVIIHPSSKWSLRRLARPTAPPLSPRLTPGLPAPRLAEDSAFFDTVTASPLRPWLRA